MKILGQKLSDGSVTVVEAPDPITADGFVRVKTLYSAISAGTEGGKVVTGKMSLLGKAKAKPDQVMQVIGMAKSLGIKATYLKVKSKLEGAQPLGYSLCGRVTEVAGNVEHVKVGDLVACAGGGYANHADEVVVPRNLVAKVPDGVDPKSAAYTTIASISLQGVRLAEPTLGESAVVIGLGIIGQLASQILKANGCRVFGTDLDEAQVNLALATGAPFLPMMPIASPSLTLNEMFRRAQKSLCFGSMCSFLRSMLKRCRALPEMLSRRERYFSRCAPILYIFPRSLISIIGLLIMQCPQSSVLSNGNSVIR